jgi:hypothetical protein
LGTENSLDFGAKWSVLAGMESELISAGGSQMARMADVDAKIRRLRAITLEVLRISVPARLIQ